MTSRYVYNCQRSFSSWKYMNHPAFKFDMWWWLSKNGVEAYVCCPFGLEIVPELWATQPLEMVMYGCIVYTIKSPERVSVTLLRYSLYYKKSRACVRHATTGAIFRPCFILRAWFGILVLRWVLYIRVDLYTNWTTNFRELLSWGAYHVVPFSILPLDLSRFVH
jgi:hypothetical protein